MKDFRDYAICEKGTNCFYTTNNCKTAFFDGSDHRVEFQVGDQLTLIGISGHLEDFELSEIRLHPENTDSDSKVYVQCIGKDDSQSFSGLGVVFFGVE